MARLSNVKHNPVQLRPIPWGSKDNGVVQAVRNCLLVFGRERIKSLNPITQSEREAFVRRWSAAHQENSDG
jgi:hypothetical protein